MSHQISIQPQVSPIVARRISHLRRGINLSHWFSQVYVAAGYTPAHFDAWITIKDIELIKSVGFDHVRFPIAEISILSFYKIFTTSVTVKIVCLKIAFTPSLQLYLVWL